MHTRADIKFMRIFEQMKTTYEICVSYITVSYRVFMCVCVCVCVCVLRRRSLKRYRLPPTRRRITLQMIR